MSDHGRLEEFVAGRRADLLQAADAIRERDDADAVHDLRVAMRRLRAVLRAAAPLVVAEWSTNVQRELERLGPALGRLRDLDVFSARLREDAASLDEEDRKAVDGALRELAADQAAARDVALAELAAPSFAELTDSLAAPQLAETDVTLAGIAAREVRRLRNVMRKVGPDAPDELLHRARIRAKRVRYVAEALGEKRVVKRAKALQDVVGENQDSVVAEERLRMLSTRVPEAALPLGRLVERERARRSRVRKNVGRAWKKLARATEKAWS